MPKIFFTHFLLLGFLFFAPLAASGQSAYDTDFTTFSSVVSYIVQILNLVIWLLVGIGLLVFIWGILKYIAAGGDAEKAKEGRRFIIFGIIGLAVMLSVWGLVNIIINTLELDVSGPPTPTPRTLQINS
jgi:hypothetical protein